MKTLTGKKITVIGGGISGAALARFIAVHGGEPFVTEAKAEIPESHLEDFRSLGVRWETGGHSARALECHMLALSSGVPPTAPVILSAQSQGIPVVGEVDLTRPYMDGIVVAITGTNGKTTTTSLTAHLLRHAGLDAVEAGNIGAPLGALAGQKRDVFVVELSSFQLYWTHHALFDVSVVTNLAPDHIDWHGGYDRYVAAKRRILERRTPHGWAVIQEMDREILRSLNTPRIVGLSHGVPSGDGLWMEDRSVSITINGHSTKFFDVESLPLLGRHNVENGAMAVAACFLSTNRTEDWAAGFQSYQPPPHRCQLVGTVKEVTYVDDSKGTNVASTCAALRSLPGHKVIILGGRGKGENYETLASAVNETCRWAVLIGEERQAIADALKLRGFSHWTLAESMDEAVDHASKEAQIGDTVLLSPACTSWDMYDNYEVRGDHFQQLVATLKEKASSS